MRGILICTAALMLAGCEKPKDWIPTYPPEVLAHWSDRMKERFPELQTVFGPSCIWQGGVANPQQCFRMTEARRWKGIWTGGFEVSDFCPDAPTIPCHGRGIWLTPLAEIPGMKGNLEEGTYEVEFVGRRTVYPGDFGHLGGSAHAIFVDRWISVRRVAENRKAQGRRTKT